MKWISTSLGLALLMIFFGGIAVRSIVIAVYGYYNFVEIKGILKVLGAGDELSSSRGSSVGQRTMNRLAGDQKSNYYYTLTIGEQTASISLEKYIPSGSVNLLVPMEGLDSMSFDNDGVLVGTRSDGLIREKRKRVGP